MLRRFFIGIGLVALAGCMDQSARSQGSGPVYRHHFVGLDSVLSSTNAAKLKEILATPASQALRDHVLDKLCRAPRQASQKHLPKNAPNNVELLRPLLDDLVRKESYVEARGTAKKPEAVLAIHLSDERARLWLTNLSRLASSWQQGAPTEFETATLKGWQLKRKQSPGLVQYVRGGEWVIIGFGDEQHVSPFAEQLSKTGRPVPAQTNAWLDLTSDLASLKGLLGQFGDLPRAHITVSGQAGSLRTEATFTCAKPLSWKPEPWKIPLNSATEPLISFTVARGMAPLLKGHPAFRDLKLNEVPNQFCLWGQQHDYSLTFLAVPVSNATNVITQLAPTLPRVASHYMPNHFGEFLWISNRAEIMWQGLPFIVPHIQPLRDGGSDYVFASIFPKWPNTNRPPAELLDQFMNRSNMVYYDWEITPERVKHGNQLLQLYNIINELSLPKTNVPTQAWINTAGAQLGNTITEISVTSPRELTLARKSEVGFTGFELALLMRWIESPGFPLRYEPPLPMKRGSAKRPTNSIALPVASRPTNAPPRTNSAPTNSTRLLKR